MPSRRDLGVGRPDNCSRGNLFPHFPCVNIATYLVEVWKCLVNLSLAGSTISVPHNGNGKWRDFSVLLNESTIIIIYLRKFALYFVGTQKIEYFSFCGNFLECQPSGVPSLFSESNQSFFSEIQFYIFIHKYTCSFVRYLGVGKPKTYTQNRTTPILFEVERS